MPSSKNLYRELRPRAEAFSRRIASLKGVEGVAFMGGLARGYLDGSSDVDIVVLLGRTDPRLRDRIQRMGRAESSHLGGDLDLEVHTLRGFGRIERDDNRRWECAHAEVVHDTAGRTARLFRRVSSVPDSFWVDRVVGDWTYFQWGVANPAAPKSVAEICMDRMDPIGAHYMVCHSLDLLIELVYALNREFLPPPKWRFAYLGELGWTPRGLERSLREALIVRDLSGKDLARRLRAMDALRGPVETRVKEFTGLSEKESWARFIRVFVYGE
ncbi:MAG: DUF4037 domain-containing protein [Candidatus Thermoplasmatota archaeon]